IATLSPFSDHVMRITLGTPALRDSLWTDLTGSMGTPSTGHPSPLYPIHDERVPVGPLLRCTPHRIPVRIDAITNAVYEVHQHLHGTLGTPGPCQGWHTRAFGAIALVLSAKRYRRILYLCRPSSRSSSLGLGRPGLDP